MIDKILELSLRQRAFVLLAALALVCIGLWSATRLPVDAVPDITGVQIQINTEVPALAAEESEKLVTQPIEIEMAGLPGIEEMRSLTKFGLSQVTLQFSDNTDVYRARQLVTERLQAAVERLPHDVAPKLAPISTGLGEIFYYNVSYKPGAKKPATLREQLFQLRELHDYTIKPLLRTVPGVAEVNESGGYERQFVIQPRPEALERSGMTFSELADIIAANVENAGGGIISRGGNQLSIRAVTRANSLEDIANLPAKFAAGVKPLLVKDLADVSYGSRIRTGAATIDGEETVIGAAMMLAGENSREVAERVKGRLAEIQEKLPENVQVQPQYDRSILINKTIGTVSKNLFEGAVLVIALLFALLGNWRGALIVTMAIPLSFLFALTGMVNLGVSGNLMSLGAVDFGMLIDGAVVIVENVVRQLGNRQRELGRRLTSEERRELVLAASKQVANPMFFGVVIITIVYVPILALTGIEGKMFHPMAVTVMLALTGALILALTLMPVLCSFLLRGRLGEDDNFIIRAVKAIYEPMLRVALAARWLVVLAAIAIFAGSVWLFTHLGAEFVPKLDEGSITSMLYKPVEMSLDESVRTDLQLERTLLREFPEITRIFTRIGTSDIATDPMPPNECDVYIFYKPIDQWPKTAGRPRNKAELNSQIDSTLKKLDPNYKILFSQPIEERFNEMLEGTKAELAVKIFGDDYAVLGKLADQIKEILEKTPGAEEVEHETEGRRPQLLIEARHDELQRYSLSASEVNKAVAAALAGKVVGTAIDGEKRYDIVVRMPEEIRANDEKIRQLPLRVGDHGLVKMGQVVNLKTVEVVEPIFRDEGHRRAAILVNLDTSDVEGFVRNAEQRIKQQVKMPDGYFVEFGGQYKNLQQARTRLMVVVPAALALIFILIYLAFGSIRQALFVYTGIPLAVTGGVLSLWLRGMPFSITAAIGFIALSGVAVLNGLVMISYFNELRQQGRNVREAVIEGSLTRLRPVLMTALVASFGFVPMAIATGTGAEVQRPLATVVIGGILSSTFLTLIVLPVLYAWFEREGGPAEKRAEPSTPKFEPALTS
ncbi:MAG: CusA/CzcA family heavy metal efflux RND transporter [Verrucomicrobia bacterium]|nr:MAG: CusA/CzcA family heavy metal efflux RND transporter [Verrucomicrobiota bacterium]